MLRNSIVGGLFLATAGLALAGQIQIGGVNGLTQTYITNPNTITGQNTTGCAGGGTCVSGNLGTVTSATYQNYDTVLFAGAQNNTTAPQPYSTYSTSTANAGTLTDTTNGVTFSMINDGTTTNGQTTTSNNFLQFSAVSSGTTANIMTIPVGVYGVSDVWTLLNSELASSAGRDANIIFNFGATSTSAATAQNTVTMKLVDTSNSSTAAGELPNAISCTPVTGSCDGVTTPANGPALTTTSLNNTTAGGTGGAVSIKDNTVYTTVFNSLSGFPSATGSVQLNDQGFFFNSITLGSGLTNLNSYLVSIQISEPNTAHASPLPALALSAITVDTASSPVPEPSTIGMLLAGLGLVGVAVRKRKAA